MSRNVSILKSSLAAANQALDAIAPRGSWKAEEDFIDGVLIPAELCYRQLESIHNNFLVLKARMPKTPKPGMAFMGFVVSEIALEAVDVAQEFLERVKAEGILEYDTIISESRITEVCAQMSAFAAEVPKSRISEPDAVAMTQCLAKSQDEINAIWQEG